MSLKFTGDICLMTMKNDAKFEEELTFASKLTRGIWRILTRVLESLKNDHFNALLLALYTLFEPKRYRGVILHDTEKWRKIWSKTDLWFGKRHDEFGIFSLEHSQVSKLGLWWNAFV